MRTTDIINEELCRYIAAGHAKPEHLYIGQAEHYELNQLSLAFGVRVPTPLEIAEGPPRMTYRGMLVFAVDAPSFIGFGVAQPSPCG